MTATAITAAIVAAVIAGAATVLLASPPAAPAPSLTPEPTPTAAATPPPALAPTPDPTPSATAPPDTDNEPAPSKITTRSARLDDVAEAQEPAPVGLRVDTIGISGAPVDPVGIESDGSMEIPTDIQRIGWYEYGPSPGHDEGSAVLTAHIDSRTQGRGVFYHLDAMSPGDTVEVDMSDGSTRTFVVDEVRQIPKVDLPTGDLFRRDGSSRLALITCGGEFDPSSRHYRDNLVVLATPVG